MNNNSEGCCCISEILSVINVLQQNADCNDACLETCDRGFLGQNATSFYNTRPIVFYTCGSNGTPLSMPISRERPRRQPILIFREPSSGPTGCTALSPEMRFPQGLRAPSTAI